VRDGAVYDVTEVVDAVLADRPADEPGDAFVARLGAVAAAVGAADLGAPACRAAEAAFLSPVATPSKIVGAPVNYRDHVAEALGDAGISWGASATSIDEAGLFLKAPSSLVGPSEGIALRFPERRTDHEVEVAVVIGRRCRRTSAAAALDHVAGYALALDVTLRGGEDRSFRKSIDSYSVLGPFLATPDEVGDPGDIAFSLDLNGEPRQASSTASLIKGVPELIAWASEWYTLEPGDVLMTGTPAGVGPLRPGDAIACRMAGTIEMEVAVRAAESAA